MIEELIKGIIVGLGASIPLGPIGILCIQRTLSKGKWSGFATGMGAAISDIIFSAIALLGLAFVNDFLTTYREWVMLFGGAIVAGFGLKIFITNPIKQIKRVQEGNHQYIQDFASSFIMTITNPGAIFLIIGMFAFIGIDSGSYEFGLVLAPALLGVFIGTLGWWFTLSTVINMFRNKFRLKQLLVTNWIAGTIIMAIGIVTLFEGLIQIIKLYI
ncbi:MAG: LysE family transporter [Bacteroidales bacterium]|nr:LysE family transporter [Bacteroidales bacterium]MBO7321254.1 LysE family transporter [Bacteroidales bacterium]MBO7763963.1 LysE family transporter [Bacteroidales bacterium]